MEPTAKQLCELQHETPTNVPVRVVGMIVQRLPFHRSISVLPSDEFPTAKHIVVVGHVTALSALKWPDRFGLLTIDHFDPFQRSINVFVDERSE